MDCSNRYARFSRRLVLASLAICLGMTSACERQLPGSESHVGGRRYDNSGYNSQYQPLFVDEAHIINTATAVRLYTPAPGTRERAEMMDSVRNLTRDDFGTTPIFVVTNLRADGVWAFAQLLPQHSDGTNIKRETTPIFQRHSGQSPLDGLRVDVIWQQTNGRWHVYAHRIGSSHAWWLGYCSEGPRQVIPGCTSTDVSRPR